MDARLAKAQGVDAIGPLTDRDMLAKALSTAVDAVRRGKPFLVDIHI